jgi:hypothetical protein
MANANDPLRFVSYLFEIAVWPFQATAKHEAQRYPLSDQRYSILFLFPALVLFLPLCLLISLIAIAYVFFVLPVVIVCQWIGARFGPAWPDKDGH